MTQHYRHGTRHEDGFVVGQAHSHTHDHTHAHTHAHAHGPGTPHPAEAAPWSLLRMTLVGRCGMTVVVCGLLWAAVFTAMH